MTSEGKPDRFQREKAVPRTTGKRLLAGSRNEFLPGTIFYGTLKTLKPLKNFQNVFAKLPQETLETLEKKL